MSKRDTLTKKIEKIVASILSILTIVASLCYGIVKVVKGSVAQLEDDSAITQEVTQGLESGRKEYAYDFKSIKLLEKSGN